MSLSNLSDAELLLRWRAGDGDASEVLVVRHYPRIRRVFATSGSNHDWVAEKVQQTFLIFLESRDRIQNPERVKSYLLGIANNLLRGHFKQKYRVNGHAVDESPDDMVDSEIPGFATMFSSEQERHRLNLALSRLAPHVQLILQYQYWDELSYQEIAELLQIAQGTVASRLGTARKLLARELKRIPRPPSSN